MHRTVSVFTVLSIKTAALTLHPKHTQGYGCGYNAYLALWNCSEDHPENLAQVILKEGWLLMMS